MLYPESPLERAKRRHREMVSVDELVGITERVPWSEKKTAPSAPVDAGRDEGG